MRKRVLTFLFCCACGGGKTAPVQKTTEIPFDSEAGQREVVATIDGTPVYADCVSQQMELQDITAEVALDTCIGFELLARRAREQGLLRDPEVILANKAETVRQFLATDFYPRHSSDDIPEVDLKIMWRKMKKAGIPLQSFFNHPEVRGATRCHFPVDELHPIRSDSPPSAIRAFNETVAKSQVQMKVAQAAATFFHLAVLAESIQGPMSRDRFVELCAQLFGKVALVDRYVVSTRIPTGPRQFVSDPLESRALFAIPGVGDVSPPFFRLGGFTVLRLDVLVPARKMSFAEALPQLREMVWSGESIWGGQPSEGERRVFLELKQYVRGFFYAWTDPMMQKHNVTVYPEHLVAGNELIMEDNAPAAP
jgi:hypothetical protein